MIAIDDTEASLHTVRTIRHLYPDAKVFARARDRRHAWELMDLGAYAVREMFHSSLRLGEEVLMALGVPAEVAQQHARQFRAHDERVLMAQYQVHDDEAALMQTAADARKELEELFNADLGEGVLGGMAAERKPSA